MRQGILLVCDGLADRAKMALPPEHRIVAARLDPDQPGVEAWLIEGPDMPEVPAGSTPLPVKLVLELSHPPATPEGPVTLSARWEWNFMVHSPAWTCGVWPDFETFRAAFDAADLRETPCPSC